MKKSLIVAMVFALLTISGFAQDVQKSFFWNSEIGPAFTGSGDAFGITIKNGLGYAINNNLDIIGYFEFQNFHSGELNLGQDYKNLGINILYNFNLFKDVKLGIGAGGYVRNSYLINSYGYVVDPQTGDKLYVLSPMTNIWAVGYYTTLGIEIPLKSNLAITTKLSLQNDTNGDITETAKIGLKIRI